MVTKVNKKRKSIIPKLITIALVSGAIVLMCSFLSRIYGLFKLQQQAKVVEAQLEALREENATLTSMKEKLEDPEYVQTYARGEYMFSKGDEKVFYLPSGD